MGSFLSLLIQSPNFADLQQKLQAPQVPWWAEYLALGQFNSFSLDQTFFCSFAHLIIFVSVSASRHTSATLGSPARTVAQRCVFT